LSGNHPYVPGSKRSKINFYYGYRTTRTFTSQNIYDYHLHYIGNSQENNMFLLMYSNAHGLLVDTASTISSNNNIIRVLTSGSKYTTTHQE
jgi:hypothetical protein